MRHTVSFSASFGAFFAALSWMLAALLLILHTDGLTWDASAISAHLLGNYTLMLLGVLVVVDIWLDVYILKSRDNLFVRRRQWAWNFALASGFAVFVATIVSVAFSSVWPEIAKICTLFALFLLFLLRFLSYLRISTIRVPALVEAD